MKRRRDRRREVIWWTLSALIVVSMLCSLVLMLQPAPGKAPTPPPSRAAPATSILETPQPTAVSAVTPTGADVGFTFAVCGDSRDGDAIFGQILQQVSGEQPAFLIHTGDLVSQGTEREYQALQAILAGLKVPFKPVAGNHDSASGALDDFIKYTGAPAAHYSFDYGQAHFALADSHAGYLTDAEMAWLDADLAATRQPLKIVVLHHPPFDPNGTKHIMTQGNAAFEQLMEKRGVRYVFAGHLHQYAAEERNGVTYVISGGAGAPIYPDEAHGGYYHYLRVRVQGTELSYEVVRIEPPVA